MVVYANNIQNCQFNYKCESFPSSLDFKLVVINVNVNINKNYHVNVNVIVDNV